MQVTTSQGGTHLKGPMKHGRKASAIKKKMHNTSMKRNLAT